MAETEDAHKAEILGVCRLYYARVWNEALDQARVEASSALRKAENIYYPEDIRPPSSNNSKADSPPEVASPEKNGSEKAHPSSSNPTKVVEQPSVNEKAAEVTKGVPTNVTKPTAAP